VVQQVQLPMPLWIDLGLHRLRLPPIANVLKDPRRNSFFPA